MEMLIKRGADVNAKDNFGCTVFMYSVMAGRIDPVRLLLDHGADIHASLPPFWSDEYMTALYQALWYTRMDLAAFLVEKGANIDAQDRNGTTGLMVASQMMNRFVVESSIGFGANLEIQDDNGNTALLVAANRGSFDMLRDSKPLKVDLLTDNTNKAQRHNEKQVQDFLDELKETYKCSDFKAMKQHHMRDPWYTIPEGVAPVLIRHGADVNAQESDGNTALIIASEKGDLEMVQLLLSNGVDVEVKNKKGMTALHAACCNGHSAVVYELLRHRAACLNHYSDVPYGLAGGVSH